MHNWSLVVFTLLIQSAAGMVWILVSVRWIGLETPAVYWRGHTAAFFMCAGGLAAALCHLGTPKHAPHALSNLGRSWLSREILAVSVFAVSVMPLPFPAQGHASWRLGLETGAALLGMLALYSMARVYRIRTIPAWNTVATPLEFFGTAFILGGLMGGALLRHHVHIAVVNQAVLVFLVSGLFLKLVAIIPALNAQRRATEATWHMAGTAAGNPRIGHLIRAGLNLVGAVLTAVFLNGFSQDGWLWPGMALLTCTATEIWGRRAFYARYDRVGL